MLAVLAGMLTGALVIFSIIPKAFVLDYSRLGETWRWTLLAREFGLLLFGATVIAVNTSKRRGTLIAVEISCVFFFMHAAMQLGYFVISLRFASLFVVLKTLGILGGLNLCLAGWACAICVQRVIALRRRKLA